MSDNNYFCPKRDLMVDLLNVIQQTDWAICSGNDLLALVQTKKDQRACRVALRAAHRVAKIARQGLRFIEKNQRWWADNEQGGWCYPPEVWYAVIAFFDQLYAAEDEACAKAESIREYLEVAA